VEWLTPGENDTVCRPKVLSGEYEWALMMIGCMRWFPSGGKRFWGPVRDAMNSCPCACGHVGGCTGWHAAAVECSLLRPAGVKILEALVDGQQHIGDICTAWSEAIKVMKCGLGVPVHGRVLGVHSLALFPLQRIVPSSGG